MATKVQWDPKTEQNLKEWLEGEYDDETKRELRRLMSSDPDEIADSFYKTLDFGTAGLRGLMGLGPNRMNRYTVRAAAQGLANYLQKDKKGSRKVLVGYDSRHHSREFAIETSRVLAGNGIEVWIYEDIRPVPMVSFGCVQLKCDAAVMITASHNPPHYNGFKVYWSHGGQVLPPHDRGIIAEVNRITTPSQVVMSGENDPLIHWIGKELDDAYVEHTRPLQCYRGQNREKGHLLRVVYTALHGTGITMVPQSLRDWGFTEVLGVQEQNRPNGDFPTIKTPNPEEHEAMRMGIDLLVQSGSDLLLGTDADTDRLGVVVMHHNQPVFLDGNQMASLCLHHVLNALSSEGRLPSRAAVVKTIVTTELFRAIAERYGCTCIDVLTGFKYIGELIQQWEENPEGYRFVFGAEESYGSLLGTHARDKDAIIACSLLCELALDAKLKGETLIDRLHSLYREFGIYREQTQSLTFPGRQGAEQMQLMMKRLRNSPPQSLGEIAVDAIEDYLSSTRTLLADGTTTPLNLPPSDVLLFWLADGSKVVIRPSGTEPKMKLYVGVHGSVTGSLDEELLDCDQRSQHLLDTIKKLSY